MINRTYTKKVLPLKVAMSLLLTLPYLYLDVSIASAQKEPLKTEELTKHSGQYINEQYGYCFTIPKGFVGYGPRMPAAEHGISVRLSQSPKTWVYVGGQYNATFVETLNETADLYLNWLKEKRAAIEIVRREEATLGSLPALRVTVRYKAKETDIMHIEDWITAFRSEGRDRRGIICRVHLVTTEERYSQDEVAFRIIINSWKTVR